VIGRIFLAMIDLASHDPAYSAQLPIAEQASVDRLYNFAWDPQTGSGDGDPCTDGKPKTVYVNIEAHKTKKVSVVLD
jgi:hypothetical protein